MQQRFLLQLSQDNLQEDAKRLGVTALTLKHITSAGRNVRRSVRLNGDLDQSYINDLNAVKGTSVSEPDVFLRS